MHRRVFLLAACLLLAAVVAIVVLMLGRSSYASLAAKYPDSWLKVKPGMTSDEARRLIGQPWADGRDLKVVDRWRQTQNGVELHIDLWFENENNEFAPVKGVYRWKRFLGADSEIVSDPPGL
jgi:hypothetical protein